MNFDSYLAQGQVNDPINKEDKTKFLTEGAAAKINAEGLKNKVQLEGSKNLMNAFNLAVEKDENIKALDANNYYNKMVSQGIMKIQEGKEEKALDAVNQFDIMEEKAYAATKKKYGKYLYGRTGQVFENARSKDINQRRIQMERFQANEHEKYSNNVMTNGLNREFSNAAANIDDAEEFANSLGKSLALVEGRFWDYGPERIALEQRKVQNQFAEGIMQVALSQGNYTAANRIYTTYGLNMDPNKKAYYGKTISGIIRDNKLVTDVNGAITASGGNDVLFAKHLNNLVNNLNMGDSDGLIKDAMSEEGKQYGANDCAPWVMRMGRKRGYKFDDREQNVPFMVNKAKEEGRHFTDISRLADGDIVVMETNNNYDDGDDHVGIYDAKRNVIIQSGTNGVSTYSMDFYPITGFIKMQGDPERISPGEKEKYIQRAWSQYRQAQTRAKNMANSIYNSFINNTNANMDASALEGLASNFYSDDPMVNNILQQKLNKTITSYKTGSKTNSLSGSKLNTELAKNFTTNLLKGNFASSEDLMDFAYSTGDANVVDVAKGVCKKADNHEGAFKFNFNDIKSQVMYDYKGPKEMKEARWDGIVRSMYDWVDWFRVNNKRDPYPNEVVEEARRKLVNSFGDITTPGVLWNSTSDSIQLYDIPSVRNYESLGNNKFRVQFYDANSPAILTGEEVKRIIDGEPWKEVLGEAAPGDRMQKRWE